MLLPGIQQGMLFCCKGNLAVIFFETLPQLILNLQMLQTYTIITPQLFELEPWEPQLQHRQSIYAA